MRNYFDLAALQLSNQREMDFYGDPANWAELGEAVCMARFKSAFTLAMHMGWRCEWQEYDSAYPEALATINATINRKH